MALKLRTKASVTRKRCKRLSGMARRRVAVGTTVIALAAAVVIVIAAVGVALLASQPGEPRSSNPATSLPKTTSTKGTYDVTFQQIGACSPTFWGVPWSVTIGNNTKVQPPDTKLPIDNFTLYGTMNTNLTEIVFSLPDGMFHYRVSPSAGFFTPTAGTVNVTGSSVTMPIAYTGTSCTTTATNSTG